MWGGAADVYSSQVVPDRACITSKKEQIVIVDDMSSNRRLVSGQLNRALEKRGVQCDLLQFASGADFLAEYDNLSPSVVIMDGEMPGMHGDVVIGQMLERGFSGRIVAWSTCKTKQELMLSVGAHHALAKPADKNHVALLVSAFYGFFSSTGSPKS